MPSVFVCSFSKAKASCLKSSFSISDRCSLSGEWSAVSHGRSEAKARKLVEQRLRTLVQVGADVQASRVAGTIAELTAVPDQKTCPAVAVDKAHIRSVVDAELGDEQICFADLDEERCYTGLAIDQLGVAWKAAEAAHSQLCEAVDRGLRDRAASVETRRMCEVACARDATVRCVAK